MASGLRVLAIDIGDGIWGAQRYLMRMATGLRDLAVDMVLAAPSDSPLRRLWSEQGLGSVSAELPTGRNIRTAGRVRMLPLAGAALTVPAGVRALARLVRREDIDVVWANSHWIHLDAALAGRIAGIPAVLHLHEESTPGIGTSLRAFAVRLASNTVAVSEAVAAGLPSPVRRRVTVIPNGVDAQEFSPGCRKQAREALGVTEDDAVVVVASRLDPCKRIEDAIAAARAVPGVRMFIAGETSADPGYAARVRGLADGDVIRFLGLHPDMPGLFRAADVVLHAGLVEGMPLALVEAQACGVPVVAYRVAGVPEAVRDGETGLLADPGDVGQLTENLRTLVSNPEMRRCLGRAAREEVLRSHRVESQIDQNAGLLQRAAGRRGSDS